MIWCDYCGTMVDNCRHVRNHPDERYSLTQKGWCEALGISPTAAEVLRGLVPAQPS